MSPPARRHHKILIAGGGTAGITTAARVIRAGAGDIAIAGPSSQHDYQPLFTLAGGKEAIDCDVLDGRPAPDRTVALWGKQTRRPRAG